MTISVMHTPVSVGITLILYVYLTCILPLFMYISSCLFVFVVVSCLYCENTFEVIDHSHFKRFIFYSCVHSYQRVNCRSRAYYYFKLHSSCAVIHCATLYILVSFDTSVCSLSLYLYTTFFLKWKQTC